MFGEKIYKYLPTVVIIGVIGILYSKYNDKVLRKKDEDDFKIIKQYLLNDTILSDGKKPILWIHIPYKMNSREWESFGSRNTYNLNQPYIQLTLRSIIEKCKKSFNVCIIDDESFEMLIEDWSIDLTKLSDPILKKIRILGFLKILHKYGGMFLPPSFICFKNLKTLYDENIKKNGLFVSENISRNSTSEYVNFFPSLDIIGCEKNNKILNDSINYIQSLISRDFTDESTYDGNIERWFNKHYMNNDIDVIDGTKLGIKTVDEECIYIDHLIQTSSLNISKNSYGIMVPSEELLKRTNFQWFLKLNHTEVLNSNTNIGKALKNILID
jgi:hypothetical protein